MLSELNNKYKELTSLLIRNRITISTMESCTSGLVACLITDTEGSSEVMRGAFVTYCNEAKIMCGVPKETIDKYGVYSIETAGDMAEAAREHFATDIGIGITGTFGNPDRNNADSRPGKVCYSISYGEDLYDYELSLSEGSIRSEYKKTVAMDVAEELLKVLKNAGNH